MAISAQDVKRLRDLTNAGMMDCKKALTEANGDFERAREILKERGQVIAAKRADRVASDGLAIGKLSADKKLGVAIILNSETDFVAKNDKFVALANEIIDLALSSKPADLEALKAMQLGNATVAERVNELTGIIGEKIDLSAYDKVEAEYVSLYIHAGGKIAALVGFNKAVDERIGKDIAIQVATMSPVAVSPEAVPQSVLESEKATAIEKTKLDQCNKAVEAALKKAGYNLYIAENEEHLNEGIMKGNITAEQADDIRRIKKEVAEQKAANMPEQMVQNIVKGRIEKFLKESTLTGQDFVMAEEGQPMSVGAFLAKVDKDLKPVALVRLALGN